MHKIMLYLFLAGLVFGSGPCLASCGPLLVSYIAGIKKNARGGLLAYIFFSLARVSVYIILSIFIYFLGDIALHRLSINLSGPLFVFGGIFIIIIGILVSLGRKCEMGLKRHDRATAFGLGAIIGLLPCGPLLSVFAYIGLVCKSWVQSLLYSFSFGAGTFLSPLVILSMLAGKISALVVNTKGAYYALFNLFCGGIIIFLGIQLLLKGL